MGGFVHLMSFRRIDGKEKFTTRRAAFASSTNLPGRNDAIRSMHEILHGCPADLVFYLDEVGISDWDDRKSKRVVLPITVSAQGSQHSPSNISEHETHVDRDVPHRRWRVSSSGRGHISGFSGSSPRSRDNQRAEWEALNLETPRQTFCQC
jgi:hypothetical protein